VIKKYKTNVYEDIYEDPLKTVLIAMILNSSSRGAMKPYASQGQQRSAVLSLKLSELEIITEDIGERPVLLLDDVMSELDADRRRCLLESISQAQVFVTCTDANHVVSDIRLADQSKLHSSVQADESIKQIKTQDRQFSFLKFVRDRLPGSSRKASFLIYCQYVYPYRR